MTSCSKTRSNMRRFALCVMLACACASTLCTSATAHAQQDYEALIKEALSEYDSGHLIEAKTLFHQAHEVEPSARTLRGMGLTDYALRDYVSAIANLSLAIDDSRRPLTAAMKSDAKQRLTQAQRFVARYRVPSEPPAHYLIDGDEVALTDGVLVINPGDHQLLVRADGYEPLILQLSAAPGEGKTRPLDLPLVASAADARVTDAEPASETQSTPAASNETTPTAAATHSLLWTWVAAGGAVGFAVLGIALHADASSEYDNVDKTCRASSCDAQRISHLQSAGRTVQTLSAVSFGLAAAAAVGAGVLFFVESSDHEESTSLSVGPGALVLHGKF